jgi:hypothetical protein
VLVLMLARLVLVGRLVWLLLVLVNLRPPYFSRTEFTEFFWTFSIVLYSKKHDVPGTGSVSVLR